MRKAGCGGPKFWSSSSAARIILQHQHHLPPTNQPIDKPYYHIYSIPYRHSSTPQALLRAATHSLDASNLQPTRHHLHHRTRLNLDPAIANMSSHASLSAAADERKARLAKLKSLKRKAPDESQDIEDPQQEEDGQQQRSSTPDVSTLYVSGRNFDATTKGPKLGFEANPAEGQTTLEAQAAELAARTKAEAAADEAADKPLDLFKLQPKKPNWDLKRDLDRKLEVLNVRTENAIARLVKERIEGAQKDARKKAGAGAGEVEAKDREGEAVGMEGAMLAEAMREREREDEADREREKADEELV